MKFAGEKGMCEKVELQYNGSKPLPQRYNHTIGVYEYLGIRTDCSTCPGVFVLKAQDKVSLIHLFNKSSNPGVDQITGWGGAVLYSLNIFSKALN